MPYFKRATMFLDGAGGSYSQVYDVLEGENIDVATHTGITMSVTSSNRREPAKTTFNYGHEVFEKLSDAVDAVTADVAVAAALKAVGETGS